MDNGTATPLKSEETWAKLTDTLALNRAIEFVAKYTQEAQNSTEPHAVKMAAHIEATLYKIQRFLYQDTSQSDPDGKLATSREYAPKRERVREAISEFVNNVYTNGFVSSKKPAKSFAKLYQALAEEKIFGDETRRVVDTLMVCLSNTPGFHEVHGTGVDFRRITAEDAALLNSLFKKSAADVDTTAIFERALDQTRTPLLNNDEKDGFKKWEDHRVLIAGIPFLQHEKDGQQYLVTVNGGLVLLDDAIKNKIETTLVKEGQLLDSLEPQETRKYLDSFTNKHVENGFIDGFEVKNGRAPLLCLDADIITGLRPANHQEFQDFWKAQIESIAEQVEREPTEKELATDTAKTKQQKVQEAKKAGWTRFANDDYARVLIERANGGENGHLQEICKVATAHIKRIVQQMDEAKTIETSGKHHDQKPLLVLSMGGAGSGKSSAKKITESAVGKNYVTASLDDFREYSQIYNVIKAAKHHADDYALVESFASNLRDWVRIGAMEQGLNLYYDSTAIPFKRYDDILNNAKKAGYEVLLAGYDVMLHVPEDQRPLVYGTAQERVIERQENNGRALPWPVVTSKHIGVMHSLMQAFGDARVDRILMFCNDGEPDKQYLLADAFTAENDLIKNAEISKNGFLRLCNEANTRLSKNLDQAITDACKNEIPLYQDDNISRLVKRVGDAKRVMLINNNYRFIQLAEKGLMNPYASTLGGLFQKHSGLASDIPEPKEGFVDNVINSVLSLIKVPQAYIEEVTKIIHPLGSKQQAL